MREKITFDDAEIAMTRWLRAAMLADGSITDAKQVGTERTTTSPATFVRVSRTGGIRRDLITDLAMLTFECWDTTKDKAAQLAVTTRTLVQALYGDFQGSTVLSWDSEVAGPTYFPHPDTGTPRFQHTQQVAIAARSI